MGSYYNVRAVRMIKASPTKTILTLKDSIQYVCLGHFDMIAVDQLGSRALIPLPLRAIEDDRKKDHESRFGLLDACVYSLYMLCPIEEQDKNSLCDFWEKETVFTTFTRIHCRPSSEQEAVPFFTTSELLRKEWHQIHQLELGDNPVISCSVKLTGEQDTANIEAMFYDSLELEDSVAVMKSNSLKAILEGLQRLSASSIVWDTYTYCCIAINYLLNLSQPAEMPLAQERIPIMTTRFSVRDVSLADELFNGLKEYMETKYGKELQQWYVMGTADHSVQIASLSENALVDLMRYLVLHSDKLHWCFNDIITRLGVTYEQCNRRGTSKQATKETNKLKLEYYQQLYELWKGSSFPTWAYPLRKLLSTLVAMERSHVMDDLARLLIPCVNAFLQRLLHMETEEGLTKDSSKEIFHFLHAWADLNHDISELESQLTQHPELIPVRYYIPASILLFELQFIQKCAIALSDRNRRQFCPLLLITDERNMHTQAPLDPKYREYNKTCPLLVYVPVEQLYNPWEFVLNATHEVAHYCEDSARDRETRSEILRNCTSHYTIFLWYRDVVELFDDDQRSLWKKGLAAKEQINHIIDAKIREISIAGHYASGCENHLTQNIELLKAAIFALLSQEQPLEQYLLHIVPDYFVKYQEYYKRYMEPKQFVQDSLSRIASMDVRLSALQHLCSECYADIAMVLLHQISFSDYYRAIYQREYDYLATNLEECCNVNFDLVCHVQRLALVISVMERLHSSNSSLISDTWMHNSICRSNEYNCEWVEQAVELLNWIARRDGWENIVFRKTGQSLRPEMLDSVSFQYLRQYLFVCGWKLLEKLSKTGTMDLRQAAIHNVRTIFPDISDKAFSYKKILEYLN